MANRTGKAAAFANASSADSALARTAIAPLRLQKHPGRRQAQIRNSFAATPVALRVKDGIILSAKESAPAETPDP